MQRGGSLHNRQLFPAVAMPRSARLADYASLFRPTLEDQKTPCPGFSSVQKMKIIEGAPDICQGPWHAVPGAGRVARPHR